MFALIPITMNECLHASTDLCVFPSKSCLHEVFQEAAFRLPDKPALLCGDKSLSYADLDTASTRLSRRLIQLGIQNGDFAALYLDRSFSMITAIFAILKAGAAYVPIDVNYPAERIAFMLEDAEAKVVLTQKSLAKNLSTSQAQILCLDELENLNDSQDTTIIVRVAPSDLAYMLYTSGSTGRPKGCMISHENVLNQLQGQQAIAPEPIEKMILTVSISFDVSVLTIFWTLLQGATLVLPEQGDEKDPRKIAELIDRHQVTHQMSLPSPYTLLLDQAPVEKLRSLRLVNVSGEVCPSSLVQKHEKLLPDCQLYNLYGPTEATVNCTFFKIPKGFDLPKVSIGIPILNYQIFILNEKMERLPDGEVGELCIGGTQPVVGPGYWNRPELTAERFVSLPALSQFTIYRTGDLARFQPDGNIEFLGRADFQVKYRGFRIELGEIEAAIGRHPAVKETVVLLKNQDKINEQQLVAYLSLEPGTQLTISELRTFLEKNLPEYMLPAHLVCLEKMPLTTNGKFDRKALPEPSSERPILDQAYEAPKTTLEKSLAEKWERLLNIAPIGRHDKFFELGGDSILAARFIGDLMTLGGASIFITTIFNFPTIAAYAAFLEEKYPDIIEKLQAETTSQKAEPKNQESSAHKNLSEADIAGFPELVPKHLTNSGLSDSASPCPRAPVFILAPPRSGTTLLRVMLAGHPDLFACNELQLLHFETMKERREAYSGKFSLWTEGLVRAVMELKKVDADGAKLLIQELEEKGTRTAEMFGLLYDWLGDAREIVDKSPSYALDPAALEKALADFPNARFIQLSRHPYSMARSFERYNMDQALYLKASHYSAQQIGELVWLHSHRNIQDFLKKIPANRKFSMTYEDLVKNPEQTMREMCQTLGLPFHEALLSPYRDLDKKMTDGIHRESRSMGDINFDKKKKIEAQKAEDWKGVLNDNFLSDETWNLAQNLGYPKPGQEKVGTPKTAKPKPEKSSGDIAIIGMACRLPGSASSEEFWKNLIEGKDLSHQVTEADLRAEGIEQVSPNTVRRTYALDDPYAFDATFFGYHPKEAELTDPQHRIFLETAYQALESAGYDPYRFEGNIGIFGGVARNTYFTNNLLSNKDLLEKSGGWYQSMIATDPTFSISRVAYKLNLRGPAVNVQTACSTGGVAVHLACQSLLSGDSDMVVVGGGRVQAPVFGGYEYVEGGPLSPDGTCRAFDSQANGMVQGHGMAMLILKKLDKALEDRDHIWAVIKSSAINNDGSDKTGLTAPSAKGQSAVIRRALDLARLRPGQISYIETHGTGTFIGDPIEMQGLADAFQSAGSGGRPDRWLIGSVKTNIGHLDAGAGIVGIIKTALSLYHGKLPPTLHFTSPNPQIDFKNLPFEVNTGLRAWPKTQEARRAGVSTFGLGGTNAHIILEEAPVQEATIESGRPELLLLSAKTEQALERSVAGLKTLLEKSTDLNLADAAYTLATGRPHFSKRMALLGSNPPVSGSSDFFDAEIIFMFPGGGAQYQNMLRDLYQDSHFFKRQLDACFEILEKQHGLKIRDLVFPPESDNAAALNKPAAALGSLFSVEYSLARLWQHWGVQPTRLIGHSMGEYSAACLAGVMSLEDAIGLVAVRGKLFETRTGAGSMLSVALSEEKLRPYLDEGHTISVINKPDNLVVSGTVDAIDRLEKQMARDGVESSKIHIDVAAHSPQVEPILPEFKKYLETVSLHAPQIPIISNVTGTWLKPEEATSVDYWLRHLRQTVRFADGLATLNSQSSDKKRIFLEVGPGQTLSTFARAIPTLGVQKLTPASARHPKELRNDTEFILKTLGALWVNGVEINWHAFFEEVSPRHIPLPTYFFEKRKFFIPPGPAVHTPIVQPTAIDTVIQVTNTTDTMSTQLLSRIPVLVNEIRQILHELSGLPPMEMNEQATFLELGFDSLFLSQAIIKFNHRFKLSLSFRMLFEETPTIGALAAWLDENLAADLFKPVQVQTEAPPAQTDYVEMSMPQEAAPLPMAPGIPVTTLPASGLGVQDLIQQQLQIMQWQLAVLKGENVSHPTQTSPFPPATQAPPVQERTSTPQSGEQSSVGAAHRSKGVTAKMNSYKKIGGGELTEQQRKGLDTFMLRYAAMTQKSKDLSQRHREWYADPRSVTGFSKLWKEICYQIAHERSMGSKIIDVDGNEYVDYVMSYGVALFGHMPDFVESAVTAAIRRGNSIDLLPPEATEVARMICEITGHDRVTLANTGTEAVLGAVRAARTVTGRDKIAVFDTDYHGMIDQFMVRGVSFNGRDKTLPGAPGIPGFMVENTLVLDYDDPEVLQKLEQQIGELAAVVIEPVQAQNPHWQHAELIRAIRKMTEERDVALIFDEIINGFRLNQRGAQAWYGVEADICAYGKSISGGLPLAAVAGKAKYMEAFDGGFWNFGDDSSPDGAITYFASTFIKNPISVAAAHAALTEIERRGPALQEDLNEKTIRFAERIREIFLRTKAPLMIQSCSSFFMIKNVDGNPLTRLFNYFLRTRGVNIRERPCFISTAHTEADFEKTYKAFELAIQDMFDAGLLEAWEGEDMNSITPVPTHLQPVRAGLDSFPKAETWEGSLTGGQQEIFLSCQLSPSASKAYNIATEIRLEGDFEKEKMEQALQALVNRHESLRTVFGEDGRTQRVLPNLIVEIPFVDLSGKEESALARLHDEEAEHLYDLQNGPLVRFKIVKMSEREHLVFINVHHIICDGWSLGILTRELGELYAAGNDRNLPQPLQLSRFATAQTELRQQDVFQKNEEYWLGQFADGEPTLDLPTDFSRPPVKTFRGAQEKISFDPEFVKQLRQAAAKQNSTFYIFMMAAYQAFLSRLSGQSDFVMGVAAAGHNLPGNANLVAHAISTLPVRTAVSQEESFPVFLKALRRQMLDAYEHQEYTFGDLVKKMKIARTASRNTLVNVVFNLDTPLDDLKFGRLKATTRAISRHFETFDIFINLKPLGDRVDFEWNFSADLFRRETIRLRLAEFKRFLHGLVEKMESPIAHLPLLPDFEIRQAAAFGRGEKVDFPLHRRLHEFFEEQVERSPDRLAVLLADSDSEALTYRELNDRADQLAAILLKKGLKEGDFVGLYTGRNLEMITSIYAILKAGGAYVPIDPGNPTDRIRFILEDANCKFLIADAGAGLEGIPIQEQETTALPGLKLETLRFDAAKKCGEEGAAYVIYTSGTTGKPKGVVIRHSNAVGFLLAFERYFPFTESDKVYSVTSMAFDVSIPDFFLSLFRGASLILAGEETKRDGFAMRESLERHRPTFMQATPTTWKILMLAGWQGSPDLTVIAGGEAFPKELANQLNKCCKAVWNGYGPTEATVYAAFQRISEEHLADCPEEFAAIGGPLANEELVIVDKNGEAVPIGVPGELLIGGNGVSTGYLNRPELTEEKFVAVPYLGYLNLSHSRFYRTGDLVRFMPGGEIEYLGRIDSQVKIRGYRIELGEIEETMKLFPCVANAAVGVYSDSSGSKRIVGYIVWDDKRQPEICSEKPSIYNEKFRTFLRSRMPEYMVPSIFIELPELPLNTSQKIDRKRLPQPDTCHLSGVDNFIVPNTPGEKLIAGLWQNLLGVEEVSATDDFFDLGGHSLIAVQMMAEIKATTGVKLPLSTLLQHSTVRELAGRLNGFNHSGKVSREKVPVAKEQRDFISLISIQEGGKKPPLYLVHGGGLHVLFYQNLVKHLDKDQPIYAFQAKGLNEGEEPLDTIEEMAAHYIQEMLAQNPEGPYNLAGYSLGGLIAWEMTKQLQEMGRKTPLLFLFDAVAKDGWAGEGSRGTLNKLLKKAGYNLSIMLKDPKATIEYKSHVLKMQMEHLKGKMRTAYRNRNTKEIREDYLPYGKEVFEKSMEAYDKYNLHPLDIQVDLFKAKEQMFYLADPKFNGWGQFALKGVKVHEIDGNHLTLFDEPNGSQVAKIVKARLNEAAATAPVSIQ